LSPLASIKNRADSQDTAMQLRFRPVTRDDADRLLSWRNDPATVAMSRNSRVVSRIEHEAWIESLLSGTGPVALIASTNDGPVGTVRLDARGEYTYEVSITVAPEHRRRGLAIAMLRGVSAHAAERHAARCLLAEIREDNVASRRAFEAAGYRQVETSRGLCHYRMDF
jgi:RimJ/RimL family protein N-acetyltransferase